MFRVVWCVGHGEVWRRALHRGRPHKPRRERISLLGRSHSHVGLVPMSMHSHNTTDECSEGE